MSKNLPVVRKLRPHKLAWLKRSELPHGPNEEIWEKPDGQLYVHDTRQGELYVSLVKVPKLPKGIIDG
jgi:hypothetical protein